LQLYWDVSPYIGILLSIKNGICSIWDKCLERTGSNVLFSVGTVFFIYRIARRLGVPQQTISRYLPKMLEFTKWVNTDLSKGFTVSQVAQKHGWPQSLVWSQALVKADDFDRFKALQWGIRTWDVWNFMECDSRFGDDWPGRIPAQLVAHILYFLSEPGDLVLDSMAGG